MKRFRTTLMLMVCAVLILGGGWVVYLRSDYRKVRLTEEVYQELVHPEWSEGLLRQKSVALNKGSGEERTLYLTDVRAVSIPLEEAVRYYEKEVNRLGFRGCHVEGFRAGTLQHEERLRRVGLEGETSMNLVVIMQALGSDSVVRRRPPREEKAEAEDSER